MHINKKKITNRNDRFYEKAKPTHMKDLVTMCGLSSNKDLFWIDHYIKKAHKILEVGCGYGRVIDFIKGVNENALIYGVEYSSTLCQQLREKYKDGLVLWEQDLKTLSPDNCSQRFDLITWMWGSIIDLPVDERVQIFKNFNGLLCPGGTFVVDVPGDTPKEFKKRYKHIKKYMNDEICESHVFDVPNAQEMELYGRKSKFIEHASIRYKVDIDSYRVIYCYKK